MRVERNVPLRVKVANQLRDVIRNDFPHGAQIPNENDLAAEVGVSRGTIRQALAILDEEGFIVRKQGSGTYSNPYILQQKVRADLPFSLTDLIKNAGYEAAASIISKRYQPADQNLAKTLHIPAGSEILLLERVFYAGHEPAIYIVDQIPTAIICGEYTDGDLEHILFDFLGSRCNIQLRYTLSELVPSLADERIAAVLQIEPQTPLLRCNDLHFCSENRPIMASTIYYKDEVIRFNLMRKCT